MTIHQNGHLVKAFDAELRNLHEGFSPVMGNPLCERPQTKFQARGERLGHGIWDLVFIRR